MTKTTSTRKRHSPHPLTLFARFVREHQGQLKITDLERRSGYSRRHIYNVMGGLSDPTREFMDTCVAVYSIVLMRKISRGDLFEFKPSASAKRKAS